MRRREIKNLGSLVVALIGLLILTYYAAADAASPLDVVINEVAWMGTAASTYDEWIELKNNTDSSINLAGWQLAAADGYPTIALSGIILPTPNSFFLLERDADDTVSDITANQVYGTNYYTWVLHNDGEHLILKDDAGNIIDEVDASVSWFAGEASPTYLTMERINPRWPGISSNWSTNDGITRNGKDAADNPINGTPKARNSATNPPTANFTYSPEQPTTWDTVQFTDQSSDSDGTVVAWVWNFGDGGSSNEQNPTHRYRLPGTYPVTLEVTDNDRLNGTTVREVEVALGLGDVDGSGTVDVLDVRIVMQAALGIVALTPEQARAADVDEDGDVDRTDAEILAEYVIGL